MAAVAARPIRYTDRVPAGGSLLRLSPRQEAVIGCRDREVIVWGAADTGKSRTILTKLHSGLTVSPGARVLYCRKRRESCTDTGLVTFEEKVLPGDPLERHLKRGPKREGRHSYKYPNGAELVVGGLDDIEKHKSSEYDWVYVQEVNEATEDDWENLLRAASGRHGRMPYPQLIGDMNPQSSLHWTHQRMDRGAVTSIRLTHADNPSITPERLEALRRLTGSRYVRLYLGERDDDVEGSFFGKLLAEARDDGRLGRVPHDRAVLVETSWDLGVDDFMVVWFWQQVGREVRAIDYYEMAGAGLEHYAEVLQRKTARFHYVYGAFYWPHDIRARVLGKERRPQTRLEMARALWPGKRHVVVPRPQSVGDAIQASRNLLPQVWFDTSRAPADDPEARNGHTGVQRLLEYRREYDEALGAFTAVPRHDKASHGASAFAQRALGWKPLAGPMLAEPTERAPGYYRG